MMPRRQRCADPSEWHKVRRCRGLSWLAGLVQQNLQPKPSVLQYRIVQYSTMTLSDDEQWKCQWKVAPTCEWLSLCDVCSKREKSKSKCKSKVKRSTSV